MSGKYTGNTVQVQTKKHPRAISQTLEVMTVQLKKYLTSRAYLDGESLLSTKNMATRLKFAKLHM